MRPRADEVLESVAATIREHIAPEVTTDFARSLLLTIDYLLAQTRLRIIHEGPALQAGIADVRAVLAAAGAFARARQDFDDVVDTVHAALAVEDHPGAAYPTLAFLNDEHARLRAALDVVVGALSAHDPELAGDPSYSEVRDQIRGCLQSQLQREAAWIMTGDLGQRR